MPFDPADAFARAFVYDADELWHADEIGFDRQRFVDFESLLGVQLFAAKPVPLALIQPMGAARTTGARPFARMWVR